MTQEKFQDFPLKALFVIDKRKQANVGSVCFCPGNPRTASYSGFAVPSGCFE